MSWELNQFITDLSNFNALLSNKEVPVDTSPLYTLEGATTNWSDINFKVSDIEFRLDQNISGSIPHGISTYKISVCLDFIIDPSKNKNQDDPFRNAKGYLFQLFITGIIKNDTEKSQEFFNIWRLDRHISGGGVPKFDHPFYHFQNGGDELEHLSTGQVVLTAAPRIPHPPLDLFLAIHFVISNFYSRKDYDFVNELFNDEEYQLIIKRAQQRMWKPYFSAFSDGVHNDYTINNIYPLYTIHNE